jgi:CubicO group peptidase (beta-lactamase class C family)
MTTEKDLQDALDELAARLEVPGVSVGVYLDGEEHYAFYGVTSIENPLDVDENTLFQFGSTAKTFTATGIMKLVEQGKVALDAPVRTYVPELKLKDESVAERVTVLQLLNHTAGWQGDRGDDTGEGDDAIAKFVEKMATLEQSLPLGAAVSYNNASLALAGRIIEKVTGQTWEQATREMLLEPLGLQSTYFMNRINEFVTRRFAVGHNQKPDGTITVARNWAMPRGGGPVGHMIANARDQIAWARFHLSDGMGVLSKETLDLMKQPTVDMRGSALGDYVGVSWLLRDIAASGADRSDGVRLVGHGGSMHGQYSEFLTIPERNFAVISMTNSGPNGSQMNDEFVKWALEAYVGVIDKDPEGVLLGDNELAQYTGDFETVAAWVNITAAGGRLLLNIELKPEMRKELEDLGEEIPEQPPIPIAMVPGDGDRYIVADGPAKGMRGYFARGDSGDVEAAHIGGRLATRVKAPASA